jgi:hypothetical protein
MENKRLERSYCMKTIKAYYIDPKRNIAEARTITPELYTYYDMLHCDTIDIVNRGFTNCKRRFDIICDEEGSYKDDLFVSAIDERMQPMFVGALLVVGQADDEGNETSLTDEDIRVLERFTFRLATRNHRKPYPLLAHLTY